MSRRVQRLQQRHVYGRRDSRDSSEEDLDRWRPSLEHDFMGSLTLHESTQRQESTRRQRQSLVGTVAKQTERIVVAAIDFGTTYSGYAFSFKHDHDKDPLKILANEGMNTYQGGQANIKTPTCLLLEPNKTLNSFGQNAIDKYENLIADDKNYKNWYFFWRFKMLLHQQKEITENFKIKDENGKELDALTVFSLSIKAIKDQLKSVLRDRTTGLKDNDVQWVITVPAIWNDSAKRFMRLAAEKAGIDKESIEIALEPEAASIYCRQLSMTRDPAAKAGMTQFPHGTRYMILDCGVISSRLVDGSTRLLKRNLLHPQLTKLDLRPFNILNITVPNAILRFLPVHTRGCRYRVIKALDYGTGGGTVDTTVHEVLADDNLKELHRATGGNWGGTIVDKAFLNFISELVGEKVFLDFTIQQKSDYLEMLRDFEEKKRKSSPKENVGKVSVRLPVSLQELFKKENERSVGEHLLPDKYKEKIGFVSDKLRIDSKLFQSFFDEAVRDIIAHVHDLIHSLPRPIEAILLVGGFSESPILQKAVRDAFQNNTIAVIVPPEPSLCVMKGAVLFGRKPSTITERKARFTYGLLNTVPFDRKRHPPNRKTMIDGQAMCDNVFDKHVEIGQTVKTGEALGLHTYYPISTAEIAFPIALFKSSKTDPKFTDDDGCDFVGLFRLPREAGTGKTTKNDRLKVRLVFGGSDIVIEAVKADGSVHRAEFNID